VDFFWGGREKRYRKGIISGSSRLQKLKYGGDIHEEVQIDHRRPRNILDSIRTLRVLHTLQDPNSVNKSPIAIALHRKENEKKGCSSLRLLLLTWAAKQKLVAHRRGATAWLPPQRTTHLGVTAQGRGVARSIACLPITVPVWAIITSEPDGLGSDRDGWGHRLPPGQLGQQLATSCGPPRST
jgi:hypothetical protein